MSINVVEKIDNLVPINHVLISVSDKSGLDRLVPRLTQINPKVRIYSTGGTFNHIQQILGTAADRHLIQVSQYTGQPETQGGLVKTLDFKIYLGLLTETYNPAHQSDLERTGAMAIDMVMVNLYPFKATIARDDATPENARGNIDIGGPCMIRASAKNFIRVASVVDPSDYQSLIDELEACQGATTLAMRYKLACKAFAHTAQYDGAIADYLAGQAIDNVSACYSL
jgi:phosphoribosylaminoimidazolecarboxamide formyltransferase/IMP cyclohydrolase